ncbi:MAG: nucleotidyltransferase domain-containing protein [Nanoarchaeota archaeon]
MLEYIYDFLSIFFDKLKNKEKIKFIILFGSFARGNPRRDSDIDIFIGVEEKNKIEIDKIVKESLNEFELRAENTWKLRGITNPIVPIVDNIDKEQWKELKREIKSYGIILYEKSILKEGEKKEKMLISYDISKLKQKDKMKVIRELFGYQIKRENKVYKQIGLIEELKADKLSNVIISDRASYKKVTDFLRNKKVNYKIIKI